LILDSSAVMAILRQEEGHELLQLTMEASPLRGIGTPTLFETTMVATRRFGEEGRALVAAFVADWGVVAIPFDGRHTGLALTAFTRYGKGRHPAALNYGDCMTYATARLADLPLLFTGADFARTDLRPALPV
jgi:ribonuclease VapC